MGSIGNSTSISNVDISVREYWGGQEITSFEDAEVEHAVDIVKKAVTEALEYYDNNVDRAYEELALAFPFALADDEATKIVDNRDDHHIIGVDIRMHDSGNGKVSVELLPRIFDESDFNSREELDAIGLYERRR